jgi:ABC-2 type transport system ATP-binding protein
MIKIEGVSKNYGKIKAVDSLTFEIKKGEIFRDKKDVVVSTLSRGLQRRTLLARALLPEPQVLFLDEPSIGLDPHIRRGLWQIIRKVKFEGRTILLTTHYIEEAEVLCDRVGILSHGRLTAFGTPQELRRDLGEYVVDSFDDYGRLFKKAFSLKMNIIIYYLKF